MRYLIAITLLSALVLALAWQPVSQLEFWQAELAESSSIQTDESNAPTNLNNTAQQAAAEEYFSTQLDSPNDEAVEEFIPNPEAVASMRQARLKGDSRAPKLGDYHEREQPTADELGDHEQYLEYERRQQKRVYRAYVEASKIKTAQLRSMIEKGKAEGISAEEIEFAEQKIRGIEEMAVTLQQDHPDIMEDSYQPPADWLIENLGKEDNSIQTDESRENIVQ